MKLNYFGYGFSEPFPHTIIDKFLDTETIAKINREWPTRWDVENGSFTRKWNTPDLTETAKAVVDAVDINEVEKATGITGLIADPDLYGAGLHCIPPDGFLKMHCDFNRHPNGWHRRVNMLIYLNAYWDSTWNGHLILSKDGKPKGKFIAPTAGTCVIFETNEQSWHGHPYPLACPDHIQRRSLALYFYTPEPPKEKAHSTVYIK